MKWSVLLLPLLLSIACTRVAPPPEPVEHPPPLARAALHEWEAWGRVVVDGWPDTRPGDTAATPERFQRLLEYWYAMPGAYGVAQRLELRRARLQTLPDLQAEAEKVPPPPPALAEDIGFYAAPAWSAAFIGFVARRAGLRQDQLPSAPTHARYIDYLLRFAIADPAHAPFLPYAPEERAPRPGDLLCVDRSLRPLTTWAERLADRGRFRPMHCDVVVRRRPGVVEVVGGNVDDLVVLRRLPADAAGHVLPAPPDRPPFVLLLVPNEAAAPMRVEAELGEALLAAYMPALPVHRAASVRRKAPAGMRSVSCRRGAICRHR